MLFPLQQDVWGIVIIVIYKQGWGKAKKYKKVILSKCVRLKRITFLLDGINFPQFKNG